MDLRADIRPMSVPHGSCKEPPAGHGASGGALRLFPRCELSRFQSAEPGHVEAVPEVEEEEGYNPSMHSKLAFP